MIIALIKDSNNSSNKNNSYNNNNNNNSNTTNSYNDNNIYNNSNDTNRVFNIMTKFKLYFIKQIAFVHTCIYVYISISTQYS